MKEKFKKAIKEYLVGKLPVNVMLDTDIKISDMVDKIYNKVDEQVSEIQYEHWVEYEKNKKNNL